MTIPTITKIQDGLRLIVHPDATTSGAAAARRATNVLRAAIEQRGRARVIFAAAPSQEEFLRHLRTKSSLDWNRVHAFHMDEYIGLPPGAPQSFAQWLTDRLPRVRFEPIVPGATPDLEAARYADLLAEAPFDLTCMGIGVNGRIA
jgi:glucosamine-6-phosphate deaminase